MGPTHSGKTETIFVLIRSLPDYQIGTVKFIHHPHFTINPEAKDTDRHLKSGASFTISFAPKETTIMVRKKERDNIIQLEKYLQDRSDIVPSYDFIFIESLNDPPKDSLVILTGETQDDLLQYQANLLNCNIIAIAGKIGVTIKNWNDIPCFDINDQRSVTKLKELVLRELNVQQ
ncbi:MAG: molybdopterin-guanine dinucleotide biosynthesis protein B [Candidatus Kariarchaeaceae archaeon]